MIKASKAVSTLAALLSLSSVFACGDEDDKKGSGVSGTKRLSSLNDNEAVKICEWSNDQAADISLSKRQICTFTAALQTATESACNTFVEQCLKADVDTSTDKEDCSDVSVDDLVGEDCTATVSDYESCISASVKANQEVFGSISCKDAGKLDESDLEVELPAACQTLDKKCPGALDDSGVDIEDGSEQSEAFRCRDGELINADFVCDQDEDCEDGSDESNC